PDPAAEAKALPSWSASSRQDASPVRPLTDFMDLGRIFATPHSANDVAQIWIAYHAAKTGGTGRGFVAAVVPVAAYEQLLASASQFAAFVLPLKRAGTLADSSSSDQGGHEFYYLEWAQYDAPRRLDSVGTEGKASPRISTAIFTSLAEYKLRQDFAQPHLALTFHTELARSHGLVLMRGELTPSIAGADSFLLTQEDAQTLCVLMQKFYLPTMQNDARCNLLRTFHTHPAEFKWEELVEQSALY
ncbi:ATP11 protein-domain-containing protein, partial [Auriculariales sp. MPI-PUGE-AT-0066]